MNTLEEALAVRAGGPGEWLASAHPAYETVSAMFGGWTAAVMMRAILSEPAVRGAPISLSVHYLLPVPPNVDIIIRTKEAGGGKAMRFWQAELFTAGAEEPAALATLVMANRRETTAFTDPVMPAAPAPETLQAFNPPGPFGRQAPHWGVSPQGLFDQESTRSLSWTREISGRALDYPQLAFFADHYAPRVFFRSSEFRPSTTVTLSVYFHAQPDEVAAVGDGYILNEAWGSRAEGSTMGQKAYLWSEGGKLLASTEQLQWFR